VTSAGKFFFDALRLKGFERVQAMDEFISVCIGKNTWSLIPKVVFLNCYSYENIIFTDFLDITTSGMVAFTFSTSHIFYDSTVLVSQTFRSSSFH